MLFSDHEYGDLQTERKKSSTQTTERREREVLLYFRFFFLSSVPPNEQKVDGWGPLKQKFNPKPSFGGAVQRRLLFTV